MIRTAANALLAACLLACLIAPAMVSIQDETTNVRPMGIAGRSEVIFWHFWGGAELDVVADVVRRFNASQPEYFVRAVAMPGNNLDLKLFLSLAGGDPPDVVNIDDPVLADWAERGAILPLSQVATAGELDRLREWLFPAAAQLTTYQEQPFGLCNGLDVRALYYNNSLLRQLRMDPPRTIAQLDQVAGMIHNNGNPVAVDIGFLPAAKNFWAWGIVFGGRFYDAPSRRVTLDSPGIAHALNWMAGYGTSHGRLASSLRARDQSLPGKSFPLLNGRYALVVDGQWRVPEILRFNKAQRAAGEIPTEFGVCALPQAEGQAANAGWINGNYFVLPTGAHESQGAWQFMKFWSGFDGHEAAAAVTCEMGGWIPVSPKVVEQAGFQRYLAATPIFASFVELAGSNQQVPRPSVPGAALFDREVRSLAERAMDPDNDEPLDALLEATEQRIQQHIDFHRERSR